MAEVSGGVRVNLAQIVVGVGSRVENNFVGSGHGALANTIGTHFRARGRVLSTFPCARKDTGRGSLK